VAVPIFFVVWFAAALVLANAGLIEQALSGRPWLVPVMLWSITLGMGALAWSWAPLRTWAKTVDLRWPILFHVVRIGFGSAFLWLYARGEMAERFALRAGPGDVAAGTLAILAAIAAARNTQSRRRAVLAWNVFGLADMLVTVASAQSVLFSPEVASMAAFTRFPFSMLPFFVVPLVFLTHALVFVRLRAAARPG
jgi:hypothetical protein